MSMEKREIMSESMKALPPTVISTMTLFVVGLQDWVYILTIVYLIAQIGWSIWRFVRRKKDE